ncbi:MAG: thiamine pyrophosphate-binding protein [Chloroflexota bacterium]
MPEMSGGQAVVAALKKEGVQAVFGIPGTYNLDIYDAVQATPSIRHILARHEGGAALMADGYARVSGQPGICLTIAGPGATNALTGLITAYAESSPVLMVTTEIEKRLIGQDRGVSHEIKQQLDIFRAALAAAQRADSVSAIPLTIQNLWMAMVNGRSRPTYLEVPWDVLGEWAEVSIPERGAVAKTAVSPQVIETAVWLLKQAKRPLIFSGLGTLRAGASSELCKLAEQLDIPVITTANGKGSLPEDHPLALGAGVGRNPALTETLAKADVVLAVGTSFDIWTMQNWTLEISGQIIRVDVAQEQLHKNYPAAVAIHGDAKLVLSQLSAASKPQFKNKGWAKTTAKAAKSARTAIETEHESGAEVVRQLRSCLPRDVILTVDPTMVLQWIAWNLEIYEPNGLLLAWNSGTLGFALPAALGAQVARPDRAVVALVGDGGFMFTGQELATAAQYRLPVVAIVFNNKAHGSIMKQQMDGFGGRLLGVDLAGPDYAAVARALGVCGRRVTSLKELGAHVRQALEERVPTLLEVLVDLDELAHPWTA